MPPHYSFQKLMDGIGKHPVFFFDFDGTLVELASTPDKVKFKPITKYILENLANIFPVGIISGRCLSDLQKMIAIDGIFYAGNHGVEVEGPGLSFIEPNTSKFRYLILNLLDELKAKLRSYNPLIEDKIYAIGIHYRTIDPLRVNDFLSEVTKILEIPLNKNEIKILNGKKVIEVKPPVEWNKGNSVKIILKHLRNDYIPFYFGDDLTDEFAFETVNELNGTSVLISNGNSPTIAKFILNSSHELIGIIAQIISEYQK